MGLLAEDQECREPQQMQSNIHTHLQIQSGKCCALGEFLTKLWSVMQVHYATTSRPGPIVPKILPIILFRIS